MTTHSEPYSPAKYGGFTPNFTNEYLLKHGSFFMKPGLHPDGYVYPVLSDALRYRVYRDAVGAKHRPDAEEMPLDFAIKQEKPPTPPASVSPPPTLMGKIGDGGLSQLTNGQAKNAIWILGKQKLSWDNSTVASYNPDTKMFRCVMCNAVGFLSRIAEHYLGTHTSAKVFQCLHCPYSSTWSRCVRMHMAKHHGVPNAPPSLWKGQPLLEEIFQLLTNLKSTVDSQGRERLDPELCDKKFVCPKCPYTTDRRDLYVRHENIHKEDKPYHCYICFKLFNRADHVKKHFLRIHRGHPYDISLVRRRPPRHPGHNNATANAASNATKPTPPPQVISNSFMMDKIISSTTSNNNEPQCPANDDPIDLTQPDQSDSATSKKQKTFQCPLCPWEGVDSWCLRRHMNVHLKNYECPICEFKAGKAERLFTHVYRSHRKLVCTKCKFVTDLAQDFEIHIKDCCLEMIVGNLGDKNSEDSPNDSDDDFKPIIPPLPLPTDKLDIALTSPTDLTSSSSKRYHETSMMPLMDHSQLVGLGSYHQDLKASVSLMPLHNSVSYCYPSSSPYYGMENVVNGLQDRMADVTAAGVDGKDGSKLCKAEIKPELASPVQSSSDSGVADVTSDNNDPETTCWDCGCEFANESSLKTHSELYHRLDDNDSSTEQPQQSNPDSSSSGGKNSSGSPQPGQSTKTSKKFSCAICNFASDRQRTIIEHMRFHTGEVLPCRAGHPCAFRTVCDSALEDHVATEHLDLLLKRCPHCGMPAQDRVGFIRHYRKCHHSKSCSRCKDIKHTLGKEPQVVAAPSEERVLPYLHHNPYSKKTSAISPYAHCNAAMFRVAVAIPPSLQTAAATADAAASNDSACNEHRPRKQSAPRKLLYASGQPCAAVSKLLTVSSPTCVESTPSIPVRLNGCQSAAEHIPRKLPRVNSQSFAEYIPRKLPRINSQSFAEPRMLLQHVNGQSRAEGPICDTASGDAIAEDYRKKWLKVAKVPLWKRQFIRQSFCYGKNINLLRRCPWSQLVRKYRCKMCSRSFKFRYQVLLHRRRDHQMRMCISKVS